MTWDQSANLKTKWKKIMHASRSAEWKENVIIIGFFYFEMIAAAVPVISWPILYFMIEKQKSVKPDSDHLVSGSNNLMEM